MLPNNPSSAILVAAFFLAAAVPGSAADPAPRLPLKGGENVLFIGNSLTGKLSGSLNEMAVANGLPKINGHHVQLWNETLETHVLLSPEKTPKKFEGEQTGIATELKNLGYKVSGANSLFKQGIYDKPELSDRGYLTALEVIQSGTPDGKPWDVVVIQAYTDAEKPDNKILKNPDGSTTFEGPLMKYGAILIEAARAVGAQPVIYAAWGNSPAIAGGPQSEWHLQNHATATASYKSLADHFGIPLIPVRWAARELSTDKKPEAVPADWLYADNIHSSAFGNALLQYMIAAALYGKPATELQFTFKAADKWQAGKNYVIGEADSKHKITLTPEIDAIIKSVASSTQQEIAPSKN